MNKLDVLTQKEYLEATNDDSFDEEELESDGLPKLIDVSVGLANPPKPPLELIEGVVRVGHKMMISGASKSGKSELIPFSCTLCSLWLLYHLLIHESILYRRIST
jgi:ABC-type transport system involved in cytochrome bd biosynthesis fused ATPase/permease subunit